MKVLLINGSPNKRGCTYTALSEICNTLENEGIETEIVHIGNQGVRGCIGCFACAKNNGRCVFNDDVVNIILEKAETADGFVFGSPVYYASPNGDLISVMDRLFIAGKNFKGKPVAAITSARRGGTTASLEVMHKYFNFPGMPIVTSNYFNIVHGSNPEQVKQDEEGMQTMRILGKNMAWMLKCIEAGKKVGIEFPETEDKIKTNFIR